MVLSWFDTRDAVEAGTALADDFLQGDSGTRGTRGKGTPQAAEQAAQRLLERFLQRVDREARPLKLNLFKRARLANSFKWRLLEKGVEQQVVDELTHALVLRISAGTPNPAAAAGAEAAKRSG